LEIASKFPQKTEQNRVAKASAKRPWCPINRKNRHCGHRKNHGRLKVSIWPLYFRAMGHVLAWIRKHSINEANQHNNHGENGKLVARSGRQRRPSDQRQPQNAG